MTDSDGTAAAGNPDLRRMLADLVGMVAALDRSIDDAPDAAAVKQIDAQIAAANRRVTAVGELLFAAESVGISEAAGDVAAAIPRVETALADLDRIDAVVAAVAGTLTMADKAIALAKEGLA